ncbi:hypothetical protein [Croceicoccus naphthovorans]|jgi:hypothetical protein|uniref:Uncharacterized protein n=3 Tax=Alphaproteobacteria TaxID=28211 RepID=A0A0G3XNQ8_9SPHN|nr:hypothetical protein [Croceicoccus naphthovorans]AIT82682.1 hypothetical protein JI59_24845 [Novosphingobium pentaromativorans US6-1]AKM12188.1 hypothetical protein AB433_18805 [Croceicoccus naphthovorans]EHJ58070.1 hypothetical protein NSU_pLA1176 [Novosphingobium pentaromativorans US6-1]MBB3991066.1 hypothetical protein [Croceicoccus naphthovorans]
MIVAGTMAFTAASNAQTAEPDRRQPQAVQSEPVETDTRKSGENPLHEASGTTHENALYKAPQAATDGSGGGNADDTEDANQRIWPFKGKKLRKLPHDLDTTLDPIDETDPCPTLPCN